MTNPRFDLAAAKIALRAAEDNEANYKAIVLIDIAGPNEAARKHAGVIALAQSDDYQDALTELRAAEAAVDHAVAAVAIYEDDLRRAELAARERLAEALAGKRADEAAVDHFSKRVYGSLIEQRIARGGYDDDRGADPF